jgi:type III restriction enzyme
MPRIQWAKVGLTLKYYPDFFAKTSDRTFFILETKGREDLDDLRKIQRLVQWCVDVNIAQQLYVYKPVYIKQEKWDDVKKDLKSFKDVLEIFGVA